MALVMVLEGEELAQRVAHLCAQGLTARQIATEVDLPDGVLVRRLRSAGYRLCSECVVREAITGRRVSASADSCGR
jgi:hypothetical protein